MTLFSTPLGQGLITLGTAGLIAIVATLFKMSGRMSRVEGKLELLIEMMSRALDNEPKGIRRRPRRRSKKGDKSCE